MTDWRDLAEMKCAKDGCTEGVYISGSDVYMKCLNHLIEEGQKADNDWKPRNDKERVVLGQILSVLRGNWDSVTVDVQSDLQPAYRYGEQFPSGARDMGVIIKIVAKCDRARDPVEGERPGIPDRERSRVTLD